MTVAMVINKEEQRNIKQQQEGERRFALLFLGSKKQEARSKKQEARSGGSYWDRIAKRKELRRT